MSNIRLEARLSPRQLEKIVELSDSGIEAVHLMERFGLTCVRHVQDTIKEGRKARRALQPMCESTDYARAFAAIAGRAVQIRDFED